MTMVTSLLFIGADNQTGLCDAARIRAIVAKRHEGFTSWPAAGYWHGMPEDTLCVLLSASQADISATVADLKSELHQDAIGVQRMPEMSFA
jgi:hypothetical protein